MSCTGILMTRMYIDDRFDVTFTRAKFSEYREENPYSFIHGLTQEECLGNHQDEDSDLRHLIQDDLTQREESNYAVQRLYTANPCKMDFIVDGVSRAGKLYLIGEKDIDSSIHGLQQVTQSCSYT